MARDLKEFNRAERRRTGGTRPGTHMQNLHLAQLFGDSQNDAQPKRWPQICRA